MAEYIERKAALNRAKSFVANHIDGIVAEHAQLPYETCNATEFARGYERGAIDTVKVVLSTPAADVIPVKHGRWLSAYEYAIKLGVTDTEMLRRAKEDKWWKFCNDCEQQVKGSHNYCPNCGAKMMEVDDG